MEHAKHLVRAFLLILVFSSGFEIFRQSMRPPSFGELGHFRADVIQESQQLPIVYGDFQECGACHKEQMTTLQQSKHGAINCQLCHAPLSLHANAKDKIAEMPGNRSAALCLRCHEALLARPETIRQINLAKHMEDQEIKDIEKDGVCIQCHTAHQPDI